MAVSGGYPEAYEKGKVITGNLKPAESVIFHAGTKEGSDGEILTSGGRVLAAVSYGDSIEDAAATHTKHSKDCISTVCIIAAI